LQGGKGIPKSSQWKIEATFLISLGGGAREGKGNVCYFAIFFGEELGEHVFHQNFASFMKSES